MSRAELIRMAEHMVACTEADHVEQAEGVLRIPAHHYLDEGRAKLEKDKIFKRLPLMLAASCELPNPGDYKSIDAAGTPVLIVRQVPKPGTFIPAGYLRGHCSRWGRVKSVPGSNQPV